MTPKLSKTLGNFALFSLRAFWSVEYDSQDVDERIATLRFVETA